MPRGFESLHATLALARGAMQVLTAIIEIATLAMLHARKNLAFGRAVALQFVRDDHAWYVLQALEQLAKELLRGLLMAPALHQDIQDVVVLVHRAPQIMALAMVVMKWTRLFPVWLR
jgi:hypothetical protein